MISCTIYISRKLLMQFDETDSAWMEAKLLSSKRGDLFLPSNSLMFCRRRNNVKEFQINHLLREKVLCNLLNVIVVFVLIYTGWTMWQNYSTISRFWSYYIIRCTSIQLSFIPSAYLEKKIDRIDGSKI